MAKKHHSPRSWKLSGKRVARPDRSGVPNTLAATAGQDKPDALTEKGLKAVFGRSLTKSIVNAAALLRDAYRARGFALVSVATPASGAAAATPEWDPSAAGRQAIGALKRVGGRPLSREAAAARLNISLATLYNWIGARKIVVWTDPAGRYKFPTWQFGAHGLLPGIVDCLRLLDIGDHWATVRFFLAPSELAGDKTPLQLLRSGRIEEAKAVAWAVGIHPLANPKAMRGFRRSRREGEGGRAEATIETTDQLAAWAENELAKRETGEGTSNPEAMAAVEEHQAGETGFAKSSDIPDGDQASDEQEPVFWRGRDLSGPGVIMYYRGRMDIDSIHGSAYLGDLPETPCLDSVLWSGSYEVEIRAIRRLTE